MLLLIGGPSGSGKTTIAKALQERHGFQKLISVTTRPIRVHDGEVDGLDYHFVDRETFGKMIESGQILEYTEYAGNWYGTTKESVERAMDPTTQCVAVVDANGVRCFKEFDSRIASVYLFADKETLRLRMQRRGDSDEKITQRLEKYVGFLKRPYWGAKECLLPIV